MQQTLRNMKQEVQSLQEKEKRCSHHREDLKKTVAELKVGNKSHDDRIGEIQGEIQELDRKVADCDAAISLLKTLQSALT